MEFKYGSSHNNVSLFTRRLLFSSQCSSLHGLFQYSTKNNSMFHNGYLLQYVPHFIARYSKTRNLWPILISRPWCCWHCDLQPPYSNMVILLFLIVWICIYTHQYCTCYKFSSSGLPASTTHNKKSIYSPKRNKNTHHTALVSSVDRT